MDHSRQSWQQRPNYTKQTGPGNLFSIISMSFLFQEASRQNPVTVLVWEAILFLQDKTLLIAQRHLAGCRALIREISTHTTHRNIRQPLAWRNIFCPLRPHLRAPEVQDKLIRLEYHKVSKN